MKKIDWSKVEKELDKMIDDNEAINELSFLDEIKHMLDKKNKTSNHDSILEYYADVMQDMTAIMTKAILEERFELCGKAKIIIKQESEYIKKTIAVILDGEDEQTVQLRGDIFEDINVIQCESNAKITRMIEIITQ